MNPWPSLRIVATLAVASGSLLLGAGCGGKGANPVGPTGGGNLPPAIVSATLQPESVPHGGAATLYVRAQDLDGDTVRVAATAQHGTVVFQSSSGGDAGDWIATYTHDGTSESDEIRITATDTKNAAVTLTRPVTIEPPPEQPPTARISGPREVEAGAAVTFDGGGSRDPDGRIVRYDWSFGDGALAAGRTVDHAYAQPGDYTVRLTVTDDQGLEASVSHSVTVTPAPKSPDPGPDPKMEWTAWMNRDNPGGRGDWETRVDLLGDQCTSPGGIEGQAISGPDGPFDPPIPAQSAGEIITLTPSAGLICVNDEQPDGICFDYRVRFLCPVD